MLGPNTLDKKIIRSILNRPEFKKALSRYYHSEIGWSHSSLSKVKLLIRVELRKQQDGRCIYCRRPIKVERRNAVEDIEHYLDKSKNKYFKWSFCCVNLSLACHPCNIEKGTKDLGIGLTPPNGISKYIDDPGFSWIHPYFDDYHSHIEINRGWTYIAKNGSLRAQKLISDLKLDDIQKIEEKAELVKAEVARLTELAMECMRQKKYKSACIVLAASKALQDASTFG